MNWEDVTDAEVRRLFEVERLSYGKIAKQFAGATIGAVAGRCRRLGLQRGTSKMIGKKKHVVVEMDEPVRGVVVQKPREEPAKPGTVKLLDLDSQACRWPFGDPRKPDFGFCGMTKADGSSYCADHMAKAHTKGWGKQ